MEKCMWCTTSLDVEGDEAIRTLLRRYSSGKLSKHELESLNEDLRCCMECVVEYHRARDTVPELHKVLWEMEKARLLDVLRSKLDQELEEDDILIIEDDHEEPVSKISPVEFLNSLCFPLLEVLKYPYLLCHRELCDMAIKALCVLQEMKQSLNLYEKYQGTYLLLVHPDEKVRRWAIDATKMMKSVDRDSYYDLQEIFFCMFYVIELGFIQDLPDSDPDSYAGGTVQRLPSHLYDAYNKKNYWLGICMLLTQLSAEAMDSLFMGQLNIPVCILNTMDGFKHEDDSASDPFWPALQCFMVILDRLGSKIWCQVDPIVTFQTITGAASYTAEIRNIQQKTMGRKVKVEPEFDDNMVTCSQMVYDCYASGKTREASRTSSSGGICNNNLIYEDMQSLVNVLDSEMGQSMRVYGSTFLWFIPFVHSIIDLPEFNASYIRQVIHYLCDKINVNRHMLTGETNICDKVTEFFTRILVQIVEIHSNEGRMGKLSRCAHIWVEVIVMCTVSSDEASNSGPPDRTGGIHRVSSTSNTLGGRLPIPGGGVGAIFQSCSNLIRLLLKEGKRTGSDTRSTKYLNLLNKQLRKDPNKRWNLTSSECAELQRCLENIVKSMPDRPASPPSAPSTPSIGALPNGCLFKNTTLHKLQQKDQEAGPSGSEVAPRLIKGEPLWDCISDEDFFNGFEDIFEAKKEPSEPVLISELRPAVELANIKPDLGKLMEIRSRLNNNQNLLKIEAIAQRKSDKHEVGQDGCGHKETAVTSKQVSMAEADKKCASRDDEDYDYDDDEPLNIRRERLMKSWRHDGHKHTIGTTKGNFSTIIISDDEVSENDERPTITIVRSSDEGKSPVSLDSPSRDYDDLSESQVFEFETQQYVASAWEDKDFDTSVVTKKFKLDSALTQQVASVAAEGSPSWCSETEAIPDEDVERACQQAEEKIRQQQHAEDVIRQQQHAEGKSGQQQQAEDKIRKRQQEDENIQQQQQPQEPTISCASSKINSPLKFNNKFIKPTTPHVKKTKTVPSEKRDTLQSKKPLIIEALAHKVRRHHRKRTLTSQDDNEQPSTSASSSGMPSPSSSSSSISSPYFTTSTSRGVPAVIPPKKVCKAVEPESTAERLGLKKKERKAFELSQRSLDSVAKLRGHGQKVHVEQQQIRRRVNTIKTSPQKRIVKGNKKLLASQDMQFFRQSRDKRQRPAVVSPTTLAPRQTITPEPEEEFAFPFTQPDPNHQKNTERTATEIKSHTNDNHDAGSDLIEHKQESEYIRNGESADVTVYNDCKKDTEEAKDEEEDEWLFLTQLEPTDMELCSQVEQYENNDERFFVTQRDPLEMDLDMDDAVNESDTTGKPDLALSLQAPNVPKSIALNENFFLKPGMSPMSQKKAKPSTTKIYAPSSRNASLVQEMEKGDKPPPLCNAAKAKVGRPPAAMPPPKSTPPPFHSPGFAQPLPFKLTSRPSSHAPKSVTTSKISSTSEPPTYKTYPRPEAPIHRPSPTMDPSPNFDISILTQAILRWEYRMLGNFKIFGSPDDLCQLPLKEVPVKFTSYLEYFNTMYPLLLLNAFEEMANEWLKKGRIQLFAKVQGIEYSNRIASANFIAGLTSHEETKQLYPKEDDLVLLWLPENTGAYAHKKPNDHELHAHFGYVSRSNISNRGAGTNATLNMTIQTRGNVSSVNAQPVHCEVIGSLISTFREFRALCLLRNGPMLRPLLAPHVSYFTHSRDIQLNMDTPEFNMDQSRAIACGLAMIKATQKTPKFLMIHGPPGTGKSKTMCGLLYKLLSGGNVTPPAVNFTSKTRKTRILLCAPSNAAIDSLMKKVIVLFKEKCRNINSPQGNCGDINLVRLGSERTISKSLKPFSLDQQTRVRAQRAQQTVEADIQRQKEQLDQNIDILSQRCAKVQRDSPEFKVLTKKKMQLLKEREGLSRKIKECRNKRQESQALVLQNAHVICCTLSTSGSIVLENAFRRLGHEPFSCVIVDEASQAKETETLIPMLYRCPAIILVGDPNQLPPTVVSQKAKGLGYNQSLMVRLYKSLHQSNPQPSPVFLLTMQYRMHPDICEFPSKYIYNNMLKNDCETAQKRCSFSWPFEPYRVFDVTDGRENKEIDSFVNPKEVKLVIMLLKLLGDKQSVRVGVITPYNAQKQKIMEAMRESGVENKHLQVEVDTVDGFQGREMDCIIVSCVRASNEMGSIGFVGNRERLNVTITRAKFSLFILGHLRTLREQSDWGALIEDAGRRGKIIKTCEQNFHFDARKILKRDLPSRSHFHPPVNSPSPVTTPDNHVLMETGPPSTSRPHLSSSPSWQQPKLIPLDCHRDPRIINKPTDPRFSERRPSTEQRQDTERRASSMSRQSARRGSSYNANYRSASHSSRNPSHHSSWHRR